MTSKLNNDLKLSKTFTTEAKNGHRKTTIDISRKGSITKEKARQLTEIALNLFPDRHISDEDLGDLIKRYCGANKETLRAYVGYYGIIRRSKRTGEGYILGQSRKGYLEIFGFMHRVTRSEWVIHAQMKLPSSVSGFHTNEGFEASKEKISISHGVMETTTSRETEGIVETEKHNNNNTTERERNFTPKISQRFSELTFEEEAALYSKPAPKKCIDCGRIDPSNPYRVWCPKGKGERSRQDTCVLQEDGG
jgi:hypothetical protein